MNCCQTIKFRFCLFMFSTLMQIPLHAESYAEQLQNGLRLSYRHWNNERKIFLGFTHKEFREKEFRGRIAMLETQVNVKPDGEENRRKFLWYALPSGKPLEYLEEDLGAGIRIVNSYQANKIITKLRQGDKTVALEMKLKDKPSVSFELLLPFLRKNLEQILARDKFLFTLYLPSLAIDLENSALPRSMSLILMRIRNQETVTWKSGLGNRRAVWLEIFPDSMMLRTLLPKKKSHFRFLVELEGPRHILQFEEGGNVYTLTSLESAP